MLAWQALGALLATCFNAVPSLPCGAKQGFAAAMAEVLHARIYDCRGYSSQSSTSVDALAATVLAATLALALAAAAAPAAV